VKALRFHPEAREELRAAAPFCEQESRNPGRELVREVKTVLDRVREGRRVAHPWKVPEFLRG